MSVVPGGRIGPYEILESVGAGGMGEVYRARDLRLERIVAIKILTSSRGTAPAEIERFQREARAIARLSHPSICTLHDVGEHDGVPFLVMEFLEGQTLSDRLERGRLPLDQALAIAVQIANALDAAHRRGVVHRDLKPGNVMITASGVKLLDFGLAKLRERGYEEALGASTKSLWHTEAGMVLGTLPYMAPEQVEGRDADARTDIFALGVVLYEMLTGQTPFSGESRASLAAAILTHHPPSSASVAGTASTSMDAIVAKCLAKNADERWQNAGDLASALQWSADSPGPTRDVAHTTANRSRRLAMMAVAVLVASAAVGLGIRGVRGWTALFPRQASFGLHRQVTYRRGSVSSARFAPDGQSFVYSASWEGQPWGIYHGRAESPDARDLSMNQARILSISRGGDMAVLLGPQNIARAFGTRTLTRVPMAGGVRRDLLTGVVDADWIPGTEALAVVRDPGGGRPWTVEFPVGTTVHEARAIWSLRVSPDGSRVAFFEGSAFFDGAPTAMITVIDRSSRKSTVARNLTGIGLAWTPRGEEIWFTATRPGYNGPQLHAASLSGVERTVYRAPDWLVLHDIAADGRVLLSRNSIRISMSCLRRGDTSERDLGWLVSSTVTTLSTDGETAAFTDNTSGLTPGGNPTVFVRRLDGSPALPVGEGREAKLSPDGKWVLATLGDTYTLLPTGVGSMVNVRKGEVTRLLGAAWLGDSKQIVFAAIPNGESRTRGFIQEIPDGTPRAITPPAVFLSGRASTIRHDETVLGFAEAENRWKLYPIAGGEPQPVPGLTDRDNPIQWSADGRYLYTVSIAPPPQPPNFDVFRVEIASGRRTVWKTLQPPDAVGVESFPGAFVMTPDAESYCYSYIRRLGDLFVVEGLK
jgi:hypothetical protein